MTDKKNSSKGAEVSAQPESFEQALTELETLVEKMDAPGVGLDQLLADYKRGAALVKYCKGRLTVIRDEVARIDAELDDDARADRG